MMYRKKWLAILLTLIGQFPALAQDTAATAPGTLRQLIEQALGKSQAVGIQETLTRKAGLDVKRARQVYLPTLNAEASYTRLNDDIVFPQELQQLLLGTQGLLIKEKLNVPFNTPLPPGVPLQPVPPIQEKDILKANINGQMTLFTGFQGPLSAKAAKHQQLAQRHLTDKEKSFVVKEVVSHYDQLAVVLQSEEVLAQTDRRLNEQKRFVDKAIKNGLATPLERERVELARQQLEAKRVELETSKSLLLAKLSQLTGEQPEVLAQLRPELQVWALAPGGSPEDRPELKALDEGIKALNYKRRTELANYVPKVAAVGRREFIEEDLSLLDPLWYVGVGVRWNIFDGLAAANRAQQTKLDREVMEHRKREAQELLQLNLQKVQAEASKNLQLVHVAEQQVQTARRVLDTSQKQYELGLISLRDHLGSLTDMQTAQLEQLTAIYRQRLSILDLLEATGSLTPENIPAH